MADKEYAQSPALVEAAQALLDSRRLVVSSGAGISKESGIPTFRDAQEGLWARYDPRQLATPDAFRRNPRLVWDWYQHRRRLLEASKPNPGHYAIAALEKYLPHVVVITQNIDGLHQQAGSSDVITLHGDIRRNRCFENCQGDPTPVDLEQLEWDETAGPPRCPHCGGGVRPDVVWFHETLPPHALQRAFQLSQEADMMLVVGTSGAVQPAASLPYVARQNGARIVEVNPAPSLITPIAEWHLAGPSGDVLPQILKLIAGQREATDA